MDSEEYYDSLDEQDFYTRCVIPYQDSVQHARTKPFKNYKGIPKLKRRTKIPVPTEQEEVIPSLWNSTKAIDSASEETTNSCDSFTTALPRSRPFKKSKYNCLPKQNRSSKSSPSVSYSDINANTICQNLQIKQLKKTDYNASNFNLKSKSEVSTLHSNFSFKPIFRNLNKSIKHLNIAKEPVQTKPTSHLDSKILPPDYDITCLIPLYEGDKLKSSMSKTCESTGGVQNKKYKSNTCLNGNSQLNLDQNKESNVSIRNGDKKRSYLGMFYAKIGYPAEVKNPQSNTPSLCGCSIKSVASDQSETLSNDDKFEDASSSVGVQLAR